MVEFFIIIVGLFSLIISRIIFQKWFNPLAIYSFIWGGMLFLFQLRLLKYYPLAGFTWLLIILAFFSFAIGCLTVYYARKSLNAPPLLTDKFQTKIVADDGRILKIVIFVTGMIGLLAALEHWYVLLQKFGSIANVLLAANDIYRMRVAGKMYDGIPYLMEFSQVGITLGGFYTAYKKKLTLIAFLPLIGDIIRALAKFGRIGMLFAVVNFIVSFIISTYYFNATRTERKSNLRLIVAGIVIVAFVATSATVVKTFRGSYEKYKGANRELSTLKDNPFFSPSMYLYTSSHVGVFNMYLIKDVEHYRLGENTFSAWYNFASKFGITERTPFNMQGYFIPMWTNTGTYLRDLHGDYGFLGVILGPYLIGLFTSFFWFRFFSSGDLKYFVLLVYFLQVITISFFSLITRAADWFTSIFILLYIIPKIEGFAMARFRNRKGLELK